MSLSSSRFDVIRPLFHWLRLRGVDLQSPHRRDAANALMVQKRLMHGADVRTIMDCGAHRGRVAQEYATAFRGANIFSFEPTPATFEALKASVAHEVRIEPVNAAVGETEGTVDFYIAPFEQANSLLPRHPGDPSAETMVTARVVRIEEFCRSRGIARVEILKLDIEGFELPAIRGCGRMIDEQRIDLLHCETRFDAGPGGSGGSNTTFPALCAYLLPRGYEFFGLYDPRYAKNLQFAWGDVMFVSRDVVARTRRA